jgi:pyruvyltransferase
MGKIPENIIIGNSEMNKTIIVLRCLLHNFGDSINVPLVEKISDKKVISINKKKLEELHLKDETVYSCTGSILGWAGHPNIEVWGSGFISRTKVITNINPPKKVHAVRGKLSREILLQRNIDCPEVYGDPVLLYPKFYQPKLQKSHEFGIIPHHVDKIFIPQLKKQFPNMLIIDIQDEVHGVIDNICSCEKIISSALHGIICADAYNIPSIWMRISDKVLGHGFKFRDYFSSINRKDIQPLIWTHNLTIEDIKNKFKLWNPMELDLTPLWNSCPFRRN